jgi:hypothetical protein
VVPALPVVPEAPAPPPAVPVVPAAASPAAPVVPAAPAGVLPPGDEVQARPKIERGEMTAATRAVRRSARREIKVLLTRNVDAPDDKSGQSWKF